MATLRDPLFGLNNAPSAEWQAAEIEAARPNSLRGGWEAGRIGTERNALAIDEFAARAAGDEQRANTLRAQNEALAQAQARVAPEVQKVEDINWDPGRALNWAGGVIGQGVSSMVEPVTAATALGGVGRVAGMLPGAAGKVGRAIGSIGGPLAAYGINQRQLAGEFANTAMQDQELMARTTPQERLDMANMYGGVAGLADTAFPGIIGHQLAGGALRNGVKAVAAGMGPAAKTGLGMLGEGFTEYAQGKGSQYAQGLLNPNRDTSGDASDDLNNALGGVLGGSPLIAAGAYADTGYRRLGQTADQIGTKTGDMIDMAKERYDGSALQQGVDKVVAAGKQKAGDLIDMARGEDGKIDLAKLAEGARDGVEQAVERYKLSAEERSILSGDVPADIVDDPAKYTQWMVENDGKRIGFVAQRLNDMLETDPKAEELFDRLVGTEDPVEQAIIAEEAAQYILENNELEQLTTRGQRAAAAFGELASKGATALGKGAVAAGKAAMGFGKAVFDGAAAEARKKNAQGEDYAAKGYEAWLERTGRAATERVVQGAKNSPAAAQAKRRGDLFGEMLAAETQASLNARGFDAARAKNVTGLLRDVGYDIAYLAANGGPKGPAAALTLGRIANTLRTAIGPRAEQVVDELAALADPKSAKMFAQLRNEVANSRTLSGQSQARQVRATAANQMLALLPSEDAQQILQSEAAGGKLNRQWLLDTVESLANGHESPQLREALTEKFGAEALGKMLELVGENLPAPPKLTKGTVNDGGVQGEAGVNDDGEYEAELAPDSDFDKRQNEKKVAKGSGPKVYGFANQGIQSLRGSTDRRDPFAPLTKMTAKQKAEFEETNERRMAEGLEPLAGAPIKRPGLFKLDDQLSDDTEAELVPDGKGGMRRPTKLEHKLAQMAKATQRYEDDEDSGHRVGKQSALEVMRDLNFSAGKIISVYRDYLRQDADAEGVGADERKALLAAAERANRAVLDSLAAKGKDGKLVKTVFRLSAGERKEIAQAAEAYFKERYVAVAEELSDAVPKRIELTELLSMGRAGAKVVEYARGQGDMQYQVLDEANLITFQSDLLKNKDRGLHIKADTLVGWVRAQRSRYETDTDEDSNSNRSKNEAYLADLLEGIAAVTDSGMVDTNKVYNPKTKKHEERMAATRINGKGEYEAFITDPKTEERTRKDGSTVDVPVYPKGSPNGIPPSLRLETMTYGAMEFGKKKRAEARGEVADPIDPQGSRYQNAVRRDQNRNEEYFVSDDLEGLEPEPTYSTTREAKHPSVGTAGRGRTTTYAERPTYTGGEEMTPTQLAGERKLAADRLAEERKIRAERSEAAGAAAGETPAKRDARRARLAESERDRERERLRRPLGAVRAVGTADAKTKGDNATPLDFFPKQKPEAVPDEFADQQFRTTKKAADVATGPEPKMSAMTKAPARAEAIVAALHKDFAAGAAMIESRLRSAQRPEAIADKKARETSAVGGQHYVMPLAHALNADTIASLDLGPAEAKQLMALRAKTAQTILMADKLKENQKVALTKAMEPNEKITLANYARTLQDIGGVPAKAAPTQAPTGLLAKTLQARLEYLTNPPADYTTAKAREIQAWGHRQLERLNTAMKGMDETSEQYEALEDARFTARQLVKKAASVLEGDASLAEFEGTAAPEVAATGGPKSQPKPSGAANKSFGTYENPIIGDLWGQDGVKVVSTNLGGIHGRGLAKQAKDMGRITPANRDFDSSPKGDVITLAVKGWAPETAKIPGRAFSEQVAGGNIDLLKSELRKLIRHARANRDTDFFLPYVGLGFGEGDPTVIGPILAATAQEPNIHLIAKDNATVDKYAASFAPGVRRDATTRQGGVDLGAKGLYAAKDQAKSDQATKFIGRGSPASSTAKYAAAWGDRANTGSYTASDRVFVSAEGDRAGRVGPDFRELKKATSAGATIIADSKANRERAYNVGEREVAEFLQAQGYSEVAPGVWSPGVIVASRLGIIADTAGVKTDPAVANAAKELITLASGAWEQGTSKKEFLASEAARRALTVLAARKLVGAPRAQEAIDTVMAAVDQIYGVAQDRVLLNKVRARLVETMMSKQPVMLADILADYVTSQLPAGVKAIARAVQKVAGDTAVRAGSKKAVRGEGMYNASTDLIEIALGAHNPLHTVLHEGVHAATLSAVVKDAELHKALYSLMAHAVAHDPALQQAYGFSNTLEFLAEGLSNSGLQRRLYKIPANKTVEKYLGATIANAWDAFTALVRKALNLPAEHQSVLTQLLDLSGRAMKAVGQNPDRLVSADEHASAADRALVSQKTVERLRKQLNDLPALSKETRELISGQFSSDGSSHFDALLLTALIKELTSKPAPDGSITPNALRGISSELASALEHAVFPNKIGAADWSDTGARKLSAMSTQIHNDLQRPGFAATHDSPIRHDGKFNWRAYIGMGEGNAAFGAGTYLSTGDKVHAFYKKMMSNKTAALRDLVHAVIGTGPVTAEGKAYALEEARNKVAEYKRLLAESVYPPDAQEYHQGIEEWSQIERQISRAKIGVPFDMETKSPTYHVSVGIMKAQLLNWDKPLSEQSSYVKKRLEEFDGKKGGKPEWHDPTGGGKFAEAVSRAGIPARVVYDKRSQEYEVFFGWEDELIGTASSLAEAKKIAENALNMFSNPLGADIYRALTDRLGSQAAASDYLQSLGILGHEYAASNGRDGTTPNYVIYDDSKITTNYVHFNRQGGNSRVATQAEMDEAKAYVRKVLGPQIKVEFKDITGYSGEWLDAEQAIEISTTAAAGALSTAYHEALHGFFSKFVKSDPRVLDTLKSLAENEKILQRVAALLAGHPAALDQLKSGEERLAYIYQFWAAGKLDLPIGKPRTLLQKVRKFFRRVLGLVRDSERAVALFEAFHEGQLAEPSAAGKVIARVLDEGTGVLKARRSMDGLTQWLAAKTMPAETVLATSESKAARALAKEFFTNPGDEDAGGEAEGYLNARRRVAARYNNTFAQAVNGLTDRDMTDVAKYLQAEAELSDIPFGPHREAVAKIRSLLQRFYKYMSDERGLNIDHAGEKYYPRVWNTALLHEKKDQFLTMLTTHYDAQLEQGAQGSKGKLSKEQVAERIWRALIDREGVNDKFDAQRQDGVLAPFFASKENRTLSWLEGEHAEPFLEKNLVATLSRYFHQGVRAAEYNERFGENGELLEARLREIMGELNELSVKKMQRKEFKDDAARAKWVSRQYRDISEAVGAMEGTLGKDISPAWRKANSWMTVYQNVRLLPLSLFASFVDPLGMVARGATMKEAYDSFLRGMKEVFANWGDLFREEPKERQADKWEKLAEHIGAVDAALFAHHVSDEYSSVYMERGAKKINDTLFKLNGMEAWNRGMRVAGVKNAVAFIERHAAGADKIHSARWLKELGLDPSNIPLDDDGQLITDKNVLMAVKGIGKSQAEREIDAVHYAINRWVEGAVLTPNAAQRPAWGSDPHYSMFFHLKQFSYSFHQTILKRAVKEMNHGNLAPLGAFVWYIPTMIATDTVKGLIQGGGELPAYMKGYDLGDHIMRATQRAGVLGVGQIGVDAAEDVFSLAGPGVEQAIDALRAPLSETTIKALPAHGLYAQALK